MKATVEIEVKHPDGLHARPASLFVETAKSFSSEISVENLTDESEVVDAKSILNIMTIGVSQGHKVKITAEGDDAEEAIEKLESLIESDFEVEEEAETD